MATSPTVRRRVLANRLRSLREAAGLSLEDVAAHLMCSASKVSRLETGARPATLRDVRDLALMYGVSEADARDLMTLVREASQRGWWESYDEVASRSATYIGLEEAAASLEHYETVRIPGLLQTPAYTRALLRRISPSHGPDAIEQFVATRLERQKLLTSSSPPSYWVVLDEAALRRQVGGPAVMQDQLSALVAAAEAGWVTIQVIPFASGAHAGMEGTFVILTFADPDLADVVYVEGRSGQLFLGRAADIRVYRETLDHLRAVADGPDSSLAFIRDLIVR